MITALLTACLVSLALAPQKPRDLLPPAPAGKAWKMVWNDEFNGRKLDDKKWEIPADYARRDGWWMAKAIELDGKGNLVINILKDGDKFVDGCVRTRGKFEHAYGYYIARVKTHNQPGHWPAFWLYNSCQGNLGNGGVDGAEIDIFEKPWLTDKVNCAIHWDGYGKEHRSEGTQVEVPGISQGWHTYALWWAEDTYIFYADGQEIWRSEAGGICTQPLYIKLSDEIGDWAGDIKKAALPDKFMVDYVRVYDLVDKGR